MYKNKISSDYVALDASIAFVNNFKELYNIEKIHFMNSFNCGFDINDIVDSNSSLTLTQSEECLEDIRMYKFWLKLYATINLIILKDKDLIVDVENSFNHLVFNETGWVFNEDISSTSENDFRTILNIMTVLAMIGKLPKFNYILFIKYMAKKLDYNEKRTNFYLRFNYVLKSTQNVHGLILSEKEKCKNKKSKNKNKPEEILKDNPFVKFFKGNKK